MTKDEIRTREDFINLYALHLGLDRFIEAQDKWNTYELKNGDVIECLTFMGGG